MTAAPVIITVASANVRGRARQYRYVEPVVCEFRQTKKGLLRFKYLDRPCRARRSDRLARLDAKELVSRYEAQGRRVFLREDHYGSFHNRPAPEDIALALLADPNHKPIFPYHPEIAQEFLVI